MLLLARASNVFRCTLNVATRHHGIKVGVVWDIATTLPPRSSPEKPSKITSQARQNSSNSSNSAGNGKVDVQRSSSSTSQGLELEQRQGKKTIDVNRGKTKFTEDGKKYILLYEAGSKRLLKISSATAVINGFVWSFYVGLIDTQLPTATWEPWGYIGLGCSGLMCVMAHNFAKHWISEVSYFPDYRLLSIGTYTFWGSERIPRLIKAGGLVSPKVKETAVYIPLKVKGDMFYSLLDTDEGIFHNRDFLMRILKATPGGDVVTGAAAADGTTSTATNTKWHWKKRKRSR